MANLVFCLMGPTASGKTELACKLTEILPFEIISIDSAMIYREMNIGTAKPTDALLKKYPHHLINILNPIDNYSVANCYQDVINLCENIVKNGKIPLLVGGTMMYFNALQKGLATLPEASLKHRLEIDKEAQEHGLLYLYQKLQEVDMASSLKIDQNDYRRIQRALEVFRITQKPLSEQVHNNIAPLDFVNLIIMPTDRSILHDIINQRFAKMLNDGLIDEVELLIRKWPLTNEHPSMRSVGYRQVYSYLQGECSYNIMLEKASAATRQLAKRQLTWLRKWPNAHEIKAYSSTLFNDVVDIINKELGV